MFTNDKLFNHPKYGYIFEKDVEWFDRFVGDKCTVDSNNSSESIFHMGYYPEQVVGNPNEAKIFLLNMNPSFNPGRQDTQLEVKDEIMCSIRGEYDKEYPFYCLNPKYDETVGNIWWRNGQHFKSWEKVYRRTELAKAFCCVELSPYHCKRLPSKARKNLQTCPSTYRMIQFIQNEIVPKAQKKEAVIILLRCLDDWGLEVNPNNYIFMTSNIQTANFGMKNQFKNEVCALLG